jgi:Fic-DOC domain mobile mystery protein B
VSDIFDQPDDRATPLSEADKRGLKLSHIATRAALDAAEQENSARGQDWALRRERVILSERFITNLHRHMFDDVWRGAGYYRTVDVNLGIDYWKIPVAIRILIDDATLWLANDIYPPDAVALRFHHRLTQIRPFANGNGRHARLIADLLMMRQGGERFTWGNGSQRDPGELRRRYIAALQVADTDDLAPLLAFARS